MNAASPEAPLVLIVDDDAEIRYSMHRVLGTRGYRVLAAASGQEGIEAARRERPDIIFLDNRMEGMSGLETLQHLRGMTGSCMVILMTAFGTTQTAIEAMKFGAFDYIVKPFDAKRVLGLAEKAFQSLQDLRRASQQQYRPLLNQEDYSDGLVGSSERMQEVFKVIGQVAASEATVMITGESGTGKELVARCIYRHSGRAEKPFMAVNCAAIPDNLIESELFGHEKGAFTGATQQRIGKFELCDGGTLFLDEIGDMALQTQTKILRALQEGEIQRVGGSRVIQVDVRLIAATNRNLERMVQQNAFREDLYYRLNVVRMRLPSLRERVEDIPQLVDFMLQRLVRQKKCKARQISPEALECLKNHNWPGNVRELENVIHRAAVLAQGGSILVNDLPPEVTRPESPPMVGQPPEQEARPDPPQAVPAPSRPAAVPSAAAEPVTASANLSPGETASVSAQEPTNTPPDPPPNGRHPAAPVPSGASGPGDTGEPLGGFQIGRDEAYDLIYRTVRNEKDKSILQLMEREMIQRALKETGGNQVRTSAILGITRATLRKRIDQFSLRY